MHSCFDPRADLVTSSQGVAVELFQPKSAEIDARIPALIITHGFARFALRPQICFDNTYHRAGRAAASSVSGDGSASSTVPSCACPTWQASSVLVRCQS